MTRSRPSSITDDDARHLARRLHWDGEVGAGTGRDPQLDVARGAPTPVSERPSFERRDLDRRAAAALDRRKQLWRDSAAILSAVVVSLLAFRLLGSFSTSLVEASPSPTPSDLAAGSQGSEASLGPGQTLAPIIDPSLGIDATPTPIPPVTLPPTGTHRPTLPPGATPRPTTKPIRTPPPTLPPTPPATPEVTPQPTPEITPEPTPEPTPEVTPEPPPLPNP
jgi:hypothetical protein